MAFYIKSYKWVPVFLFTPISGVMSLRCFFTYQCLTSLMLMLNPDAESINVKGALRRPAKRFCCVCLVGFKQRPLDFTTKTWEQNYLVDYTCFKKNTLGTTITPIRITEFCQMTLKHVNANPPLCRRGTVPVANFCQVLRGSWCCCFFGGWPCVVYYLDVPGS